ncbi:enoyl-CoA hydratase-related protein [Mesorhizobium sp. B2-3-5]|uniref:enoyl-CoA hydratase-related protein n=1 Tax=Mesorhizobium sp. B2-3-5 TaxID=2589958 RepID=UPI0011292719|nr:enoyl-CoA hydratase-related protein [Mesorhizobium sp. B2-3-5]TPM24255.1 2,3-dehydroadipyl-CoA hydratase [Mesorhizobium sp. B2-3-5]
MDQHLLEETPTDGLLLLRLNRPQRRNALTKQLVLDIAQALAKAASSSATRAVIITGDERAFSAGADILEVNERGIAAILDEERLAAWRAIETFPKPLIAAVRGFAYGAGNELAMICDLVVAGTSAQFGQPEVKIGGMAGDGGTQRLPRLVGRQVATKMLLTGAPLSAQEAKQAGLVCDVVGDDLVVQTAIELATAIAANAPLSIAVTKSLIRRVDEGGLVEGLRWERDGLLRVFQSEDRVEGMTAFAEKRRPTWSGR